MTDSPGDAKKYAFLLLRYRDRSTAELKDRLQRRGYSEAVITRAMEELAEAGFINDAALAQSLAETARNVRHLGERGVAHFLKQRGIGDELVLVHASPDDREFSRGLLLGEKKLAALAAYPPNVKIRKIRGFLLRKGYSFDTVRSIIAALFEPPDSAEES